MINFSDGEALTILGRDYVVKYYDRKLLKPRVVLDRGILGVYQSELKNIQHKTILEKFLKELAKSEISRRTKEISHKYNFQINKVTVRDQSSRWGSCSSAKNISLNWRLIFASPEILDYVIVHELCHTVQMNHSKDFWNLVEVVVPNWRISRKWLRENGAKLEVKSEK